MQTYFAEPATDHRDDHGEGPCWDHRTGSLLWIDQYEGIVHVAELDASTGAVSIVRDHPVGSPVGAVVPTAGDDWLLACAGGFGRLHRDGRVELLDQPEQGAAERMRMNDGKCDAQGRFWAGSMAFAKTPGAGSLYRLDPDLTLHRVLAGTTISNGLVWTDDGRSMYYIDTPTQRVDRFRVDADGEISDRTPVVVIEDADGHPDGMTIDAEGCLWVALWDGWGLRRYSPAGELLATVRVDAPQVSSCCFGGPDLGTLFITTSQEDMSPERRAEHPNSGRLFRADVGVAGRPADVFGG